MNATEALQKISKLLNLNFKAESFYSTKLKDGMTEITNNKTEELRGGFKKVFDVKMSSFSMRKPKNLWNYFQFITESSSHPSEHFSKPDLVRTSTFKLKIIWS